MHIAIRAAGDPPKPSNTVVVYVKKGEMGPVLGPVCILRWTPNQLLYGFWSISLLPGVWEASLRLRNTPTVHPDAAPAPAPKSLYKLLYRK